MTGGAGGPEISVVIPTFNRCPILLRCLAALAAQTVEPGRFEVIVVDDGSTDGTAGAAAGFARGAPIAVTVLVQPNSGANAARNRAIGMAQGALSLILNDDSIATPSLIAEHLRLHAAHSGPADAVLGRLDLCPDPPPGLFERLHHDHRLDALAEGTDLGWQAFYTFNLSAKTALLRRHGGFDAGLRWHEDIEFGWRLRAEGLRVLWAPGALAHHLHPMQEAAWLGIAAREGTALATWLARRPEMRAELVALGLHSRRLGTRAGRHAVADLAINGWTEPAWLALARALARPAPGVAAMAYRKIFQARKRRAIDAALGAT
jgi:GT2 family glycosyltransferase